jgi:sigma-B regulation protein RsbQ
MPVRKFARVTFLSDNDTDLRKLHVLTGRSHYGGEMIAPVAAGDYVHRHTAGGALPDLSAGERTDAMKARL